MGLPGASDPATVDAYNKCIAGGTGSERLEILGDSVLYMLATEIAYRNEGMGRRDIHFRRGSIITNRHLARRGRSLGIERAMARGKTLPDKAVADAVEAVIGAMWIARGHDETIRWVSENIYNETD